MHDLDRHLSLFNQASGIRRQIGPEGMVTYIGVSLHASRKDVILHLALKGLEHLARLPVLNLTVTIVREMQIFGWPVANSHDGDIGNGGTGSNVIRK